MPKKTGGGRRGRPIGFKLSEESKRAISMSKMGQRHKPETRDKISRALIGYFKRMNPLSDEISCSYGRFEDACIDEWIEATREELNMLEDVMTDKSMRNSRRIEITCGQNIEYFSHNLTPELILIFKEHCQNNGLDPSEFYDTLEDT
ncbi:hypothetical protein DRQ25_01560 [Candidatus Fermentibacteria bacterium]|nr:MAG: hypothetical protein DRQ25_01560 [Candidatus Fermentibacteria bacterium]